jgi:hypothetical protein
MLKFAVDGWRKTSLPTGRLAVEEIFSFLALTPCGIFQSPSSTGVRRFPLRFFQRKRKDLLFMNVVLYSTTPIPMRFFETPAEGRRSSRTAGVQRCRQP